MCVSADKVLSKKNVRKHSCKSTSSRMKAAAVIGHKLWANQRTAFNLARSVQSNRRTTLKWTRGQVDSKRPNGSLVDGQVD